MVTAASLKELFEQRRRMREWLERGDILEAGRDWLRMELANDIRYMTQEAKHEK